MLLDLILVVPLKGGYTKIIKYYHMQDLNAMVSLRWWEL
jgi:hypothetical protein